MEADNRQLQNGNDRGSPDREYDDVLLAPPLAAAQRYAVINVDRIQSDEVYQELLRKEPREPVAPPSAPPTQKGLKRNPNRGGMEEASPFAGTDRIMKEIQELKGIARILCACGLLLALHWYCCGLVHAATM